MNAIVNRRSKEWKAIAASIAEYAIECSINKFFGSEVLDYIADEGSSTTWWIWIYGGI